MGIAPSSKALKLAWTLTAGMVLVLTLPLDATRDLNEYAGQRVVVAMTGDASSGVNSVKFHGSVTNYLPSIRHDAPVNEFEVGLPSGEFVLRQTDLFVPGPMPISITRTWHGSDKLPHAFGPGTNHPYDIYPTGSDGANLYAGFHIVLEDGISIPFRRISRGTSYADGVYRHEESASEFRDAQVNWNGNGWTLRFPDLSQVVFPDSYHGTSSWFGGPVEMHDGHGNGIRFQRTQARTITRLTGPTGHGVAFQYDDSSRIIRAADDSGNTRRYGYDSSGHLSVVADASRVLYRFVYEPLLPDARFEQYLMTHITDADDHDLVQISYEGDRVVSVTLADGSTYRYDYKWGADNRVHSVVVRFPGHRVSEFQF